MLSNEFIAMQWTKARQTELMEERKQDRLLRYLVREYKAQLRERRNNTTNRK
jgi:hypothetical protein